MKNFKSYLFVGLFSLTLSQSNTVFSMDVEAEEVEREDSPRSSHGSHSSWESMGSRFEADDYAAKKALLTQIDIKVKELAQNVTNPSKLKVIMGELKAPVLNLALFLENDDKMPDQNNDESDEDFNQEAALVELTELTTEMLATDLIDDTKLPILMKKLLILIVSISDGEFAEDFLEDFMQNSTSDKRKESFGDDQKKKQHRPDSDSDDDDKDDVDELGNGLSSMLMQEGGR